MECMTDQDTDSCVLHVRVGLRVSLFFFMITTNVFTVDGHKSLYIICVDGQSLFDHVPRREAGDV